MNIKNVVELMLDMVENGATKDEMSRIIDISKNVIDGYVTVSMSEEIAYFQDKYSQICEKITLNDVLENLGFHEYTDPKYYNVGWKKYKDGKYIGFGFEEEA